ncbi:MAG: hypothetical protein NTW78_01985 [Campylobacterales bacterium]|nr:hypothetical protein [Campylobacterales bacterium]
MYVEFLNGKLKEEALKSFVKDENLFSENDKNQKNQNVNGDTDEQ